MRSPLLTSAALVLLAATAAGCSDDGESGAGPEPSLLTVQCEVPDEVLRPVDEQGRVTELAFPETVLVGASLAVGDDRVVLQLNTAGAVIADTEEALAGMGARWPQRYWVEVQGPDDEIVALVLTRDGDGWALHTGPTNDPGAGQRVEGAGIDVGTNQVTVMLRDETAAEVLPFRPRAAVFGAGSYRAKDAATSACPADGTLATPSDTVP